MAPALWHGSTARKRQNEVGTVTTAGVARDRAGFSFVEVLIALAILISALGAFAQIAAAGQRLARSQSEATDLHQRLRVAVERIRKDLAQAGAGVVRGPASGLSGSLTNYVAPILPARLGSRLPDAALSAFSDRVSIFYAAEGAWPSPLTVSMADVDQPLFIDPSIPGCPGIGLCGFEEGTRAMLIDTRGAGAGHEVFTVNGVAGALLHDAPESTIRACLRRRQFDTHPGCSTHVLLRSSESATDALRRASQRHAPGRQRRQCRVLIFCRQRGGERRAAARWRVELRLQSRFSAAPSSWHLRDCRTSSVDSWRDGRRSRLRRRRYGVRRGSPPHQARARQPSARCRRRRRAWQRWIVCAPGAFVEWLQSCARLRDHI